MLARALYVLLFMEFHGNCIHYPAEWWKGWSCRFICCLGVAWLTLSYLCSLPCWLTRRIGRFYFFALVLHDQPFKTLTIPTQFRMEVRFTTLLDDQIVDHVDWLFFFTLPSRDKPIAILAVFMQFCMETLLAALKILVNFDWFWPGAGVAKPVPTTTKEPSTCTLFAESAG